MKSNFFKDRVVYSTEHGKICPGCINPVKQCICCKETTPIGDGNVRVSRETKGRKGKVVTLVKGLAMDAATLKLMSKELKAICSSGGTVKEGVIEIQGDHIGRILDYLNKQGVTAKRAGG
jgi:translation initiation factor 1